MCLFVTVWGERPSPARTCVSLPGGEAAGWLALDVVPSFTVRMDFPRSAGLPPLVFPVLLPMSRRPPYGSQSQNHEEEQLFCGPRFAPGSSQPREGGDEAAAALGPNSWRVPEGKRAVGRSGFVRGNAEQSCPSPSPSLGRRRRARREVVVVPACCPRPVPLRNQPVQEIEGLFPSTRAVKPGAITSDADV